MKRFKSVNCLSCFNVIKIKNSYTLPNLYYFELNGKLIDGFFFKSNTNWFYFYGKSIYRFGTLSGLFDFVKKRLGGA